ncbi:hypothetical protein K3495_g10974 [Podosphaera aphanis]|nr:hypothetical protein K3495_g10974 [Podosphaera aphanis]
MVKKRNRDPEVLADAPAPHDPAESGSEDEMDIVQVDFEWFNFKPTVDFHGVKTLLRQLFDVDAPLFDLSSLADLIVTQSTIGSTVKVDGEETDAYAMVTVLNLNTHRENSVIKEVTKYLLDKSASDPNLAPLNSLLRSSAQVGLILSERLINVPAEVAPPMYEMLIDEIEAAVEDNEPYNFTHYLIFSKTYQEVVSALDQEEKPLVKKKKASKLSRETFYFHPEDEILQTYASMFGTFDYTNDEGDGMADSKRAFSDMGIKPHGFLMLIEGGMGLKNAVQAMKSYLNPSS